ncbi:MAG: tetraacyldisaccharide 4'-kinase [Candidatus Thioglobus sp. MED-G23]|jgi:tetraacyldisaccharide 4'-kinase|nr:MAG: tetraacyldisaccharide 4'-kinase [Candidatus Thioglobus sp. MED-G23]|tara:strand:+ start:4268 stop:5260 length:993 start_codon:yes stop_codon:yes gene_type:complete
MTLAERIQQHWRTPTAVSLALTPFSLVYGLVTKIRKAAYISGVLKTHRFDIPVVVVGNLTVGGTGKTPFVITLAERLKIRGWRPGIVSRGYRGKVTEAEIVPADGDPHHFGDEPVLVARKTGLPVAVARRRAQSVEKLLNESVDIVISDDGLQHYAMARSAEIVMVDGIEGLGNGFLLPAGPLREPPARLASADIRVRRGGEASEGEYSVTAALGSARNLVSGEEASLDEFRDVPLAALAGIHRPERFFDLLRQHGLTITAHPFPDHHQFCADDIPAETTVLMTEKDAVKCGRFASDRCWSVSQVTEIPEELIDKLESVIHQTGQVNLSA